MACPRMRSPGGWLPREPRPTAPPSGRSSPRKGSGGCCAARSPKPASARQPPAATRPCPARPSWTSVPGRLETTRAGLLLALPDLVTLDLPALVRAVGYPGTRVIPDVCWLLSLLALKLTPRSCPRHRPGLLRHVWRRAIGVACHCAPPSRHRFCRRSTVLPSWPGALGSVLSSVTGTARGSGD